MLALLIGSAFVEKFTYLYGKIHNASRTEARAFVLQADVRTLSREVERLFNLPPKEAYHYAEILKREVSFKEIAGSASERLNAVTYVGCDATPIQNWQWGTDGTIPAGCTGADRCWGTNLGGSYVNNMDDTLYSPVINASGYNRVLLTFDHYYYTESGLDKGYVLCSSDGGTTWNVVGGPYSGGPTGWVAETLDISVCGNTANLRVAFLFQSDGSITYDGWYVDDVSVIGINVLSSTILYASSFEGTDDGDLVPVITGGSAAPWQRGSPTSGPGAARFGTSVWATNLSGDYSTDVDEAIQKQTPVSLTGGYSSYILRFHHWYDTETSFDSGWVEISVDGGATWTKISPAYKGHDATWYVEQIDLTPYAGSNVLFRFRFQSDGSVTYPGWYIDSVSIKGENVSPPVSLAYYDFNANDGGFTATSHLTTPEPYSITNNFLEWWFDILTTDDFGTYTARTGTSHTYPGITLLYGAQFSPPSVWSSWTTIHSVNSSTDYIGKSGTATPPAGFTQDNLKNYASQVICEPSVPRVTFVYDIKNGADTLLVKEIFWITGSNVNNSRLWHRTVVINQSSSCASVGVRWEYDTHVDATDHPAQYQCDYYPSLTLSCGSQITTPVQVGPPLPSTFDFLREADTDPPSGTKYHLFAVGGDGTTITPPDFVYHTRWPNAHDNTWTYTLSTDDISVGTGLDNAFVYFWNPVTCILPGDSVVYESFFGSPTDPVGNDDDLGISEMKIGRLSIRVEGRKVTFGDRVRVAVYSADGREVFSGSAKEVKISVPGVYFVRVRGKVYRVVIR